MQPVKYTFRASTRLVLILGFLLLQAHTQAVMAQGRLGPVAGVVVDPSGKPASGANVWLLSSSSSLIEVRVLARTVSDEQGQFRLDAVKCERTSSQDIPPVLTAQDSRGRIGTSGISMRQGNQLPRYCRIALLEEKGYEGRLVDEEGRPIAKAAVRPLLWMGEGGSGSGMYPLLMLPLKLQDQLGVETNADGRFTLRRLPASGMIYARLEAGDFGAPLARWKLEKPVSIRLKHPGGLQGSFTCPQPAAVGGIRFLLIGNTDAPQEADFSTHYFGHGTTQPDGTFRFERLTPGRYLLQPELPADLPYGVEEVPVVEVKPNETAKMSLTLKPAVKVKGRVVDQKTKKGVGGVRLTVYSHTDATRRETITNAEGTFVLYVNPGRAGVSVWQVPDQYVLPSSDEMRMVDLSEQTTVPDINLERAVNVEVNVVDAQGKPVPDAEIRFADSQSSGEAFREVLRTDAAGKVFLGTYAPKETLKVRARSRIAASDQKVVALARLREPVHLVLSEKTTFALRGAVVDDAGKPIPQAKISLMAEMDLGRERGWYGSTVSIRLERCESDAEGGFALGGLWSKDKYVVLIKVPGHERYASARIEAAGGLVHDFGKLVLARTAEAVEGGVIDSAGKPLAGALVFNSGDGPEPMETRSDAAGKFRLEGFRKGPVCVFALKEGYRFAGLRTTAGATDAELKMLRVEEPVPTGRLESAPPLSYEEEKKLARALLEKLWAAASDKRGAARSGLFGAAGKMLKGFLGSKGDGRKESLISLMERIDPEQARRWATEGGVKPAAAPEADPLVEIAKTDLDEALSLLEKDLESASRQLHGLADHFSQSDPPTALRCAEEGIVRVRSLDQPDRALELVRWAGTVIGLGSKDAGKKLIEEAAEMADRWKPSDRYNRAFGQIAVALAPYDASKAIRLLEKIGETPVRENYQARVASALDDPAQAESLLKKLEPAVADRARLGLAFRIASSRPAEAVRLVEELSDTGSEAKAGRIALLAESISTRDSALTCSLIDRVLAIYLPPSKPLEPGGVDRSLEAARLAVLARKVGHPNLEGVILQALALRPTPGEDESPIPAVEATLRMAKIMALADPATAKQMLLTLDPAVEALDDRAEWFQAWALADPRQAMEMAERELTAARQGKSKIGPPKAVQAMAEIWITPPDQRIQRNRLLYGINRGIGSPMDEEISNPFD